MVAAIPALAVATTAGGRALCRQSTFFRVRQVEVAGLQHLGVDTVIASLGLESHASVCDPLGEGERRVRALGGVTAARVSRRVPGTIRVTVAEVVPVAFVADTAGLRVVDRLGGALPFDPTSARADLPVVASTDRALLGVLARLQAVTPDLALRVGSGRLIDGDVALDLDRMRLWLAPDAPAEVLRGVAAVLAELDRRDQPAAELDARFANQIIVRRRGGSGV